MTEIEKEQARTSLGILLEAFTCTSLSDLPTSYNFQSWVRRISAKHQMEILSFSLSRFADEIRFHGEGKIVEYLVRQSGHLEHLSTQYIYPVRR
jgi:hypothetical protein